MVEYTITLHIMNTALSDGSSRYVTLTAISPKPMNTTSGNKAYRDHLGNIRAVISERGDVVQTADYYPFGAPFCDNADADRPTRQPYKFNGKELDMEHGLNTYDYGARQYYPALPMWDRPDPMCESYYHASPYAYCNGNPILYIDYKGKEKINGFDQNKQINRYATTSFIDQIQDNNNAIIIFGHGSPNGMHIVYNGEDKIYNTPNEFTDFLEKNSKLWQGRQILREPIEIILYSCLTGAEDNNEKSFARKLSEHIPDISIYAPDEKISIYCDYGFGRIDNGKNWKEYKGGKLLNEYIGTSIPGTNDFNKYQDNDKNFLFFKGDKNNINNTTDLPDWFLPWQQTY